MSQDEQGQPSDFGGMQALRVGSVRPDKGPFDSFETDSMETDAGPCERMRTPEPVPVYAVGVSMADHHAGVTGDPH